jgi:hypothetical protein
VVHCQAVTVAVESRLSVTSEVPLPDQATVLISFGVSVQSSLAVSLIVLFGLFPQTVDHTHRYAYLIGGRFDLISSNT